MTSAEVTVIASALLVRAMLAQSPALDPTVGSLIGNLGIMGVLVWYLWYNTTSSYPKMMERFAAEQRADREMYAAEQRAAREAFAGQMEAQRNHAEREMGELRAMLYQAMTAMRTAVHDTRDVAQGSISKVAVMAQEAMRRDGGPNPNPNPNPNPPG